MNKLSVVLSLFFLLFSAQFSLAQTDAHDENFKDYNFKKLNKTYGIKNESFYVMMRDSTLIAVDVFLPKQLAKKGEKLPTILYQTRYWRSVELIWPLNKIYPMIPSTYNYDILDFVRNGYAVVTVDVRGSGASYGNKKSGLPSKDEVADAKEILDWITTQDWSNGKIGATGISYIGITAYYTLIHKHPALKAVVPISTLFEAYEDIAMPGGIFNQGLASEWNEFCQTLDNNMLPEHKRNIITNTLAKGVKRVNRNDICELEAALNDHQNNIYQSDDGYRVKFLDDETSANKLLKMNEISNPVFQITDFFESNVPVYAYSGWYDGALQNGAVKIFLNNNHPDNKLILGPWNHAGENFYKNNGISKSKFHHTGEVMKFFDYHLKGEKNPLEADAKVHYYTLIENKWKSSDTWPPKGLENKVFYLADDSALTNQVDDYRTTVHKMDTTASSDIYSRWNFMYHKKMKKTPSVGERDGKAILHISEALIEDLEITGHSEVKLFLEANNEEMNLFVYLEDVHPDGSVYPIADGLLRTIHKKVIDEETAPLKSLPFYRSFKKEDAEILSNNEPTEVRIPLSPISYLVKKGHKIRLSIAASDTMYYRNLSYPADTIRLYKDKNFPSQIFLSVMPNK